MPIRYSISADFDLLMTRWTGEIDIDECRDGYAAYLEDENYVIGRRELCDFSGATRLDADFSRIWSILNLRNRDGSGFQAKPLHVVLAPHETIFGMARIYQSLAENAGGVRVEVFRTATEVLAALGLPGRDLDEMEALGRFQAPRRRAG